eukprot:3959167-Alexandrium_andersonii.AAC.1
MQQGFVGFVSEADQIARHCSGIVVRVKPRVAQLGESMAGGPFGLLCCSIARAYSLVDGDLIMYTRGFVPRHILHEPWNGVRKYLMDVMVDAAQQRTATTRKSMDDMA